MESVVWISGAQNESPLQTFVLREARCFCKNIWIPIYRLIYSILYYHRFGEIKVSQYAAAVLRDENIPRMEGPMDDAIGMKRMQALQNSPLASRLAPMSLQN